MEAEQKAVQKCAYRHPTRLPALSIERTSIAVVDSPEAVSI